jgi:hypothetical protein
VASPPAPACGLSRVVATDEASPPPPPPPETESSNGAVNLWQEKVGGALGVDVEAAKARGAPSRFGEVACQAYDRARGTDIQAETGLAVALPVPEGLSLVLNQEGTEDANCI